MLGAQIATRSPGSMPGAMNARAASFALVGERGIGERDVAVYDRLPCREAGCAAAEQSWDRAPLEVTADAGLAHLRPPSGARLDLTGRQAIPGPCVSDRPGLVARRPASDGVRSSP